MKIDKKTKEKVITIVLEKAKKEKITISDNELDKLINEEWKFLVKEKDKPYSLYKVIFSYFEENKNDYSQSHGGVSQYHISAKSSREAKIIASEPFYKECKYADVSIRATKVKLPDFVVLLDSGLVKL